eukprot:TRINITY_DN103221_c0_g1_i1.p1 TRINITY_DN103221_c0_g1~~TRINITY_DN103221_c0_g1_i1.p1  ORF type:complete len:343 (-),score=72.86 TRINITY_DN103221_c0_g1_i1:84-1112(-)
MRFRFLLQQALGTVRRLPQAAVRVKQGGGGQGCRLGVASDDLHAFFAGEAPMLVFKGALDPERCHTIAQRLEAVAERGFDSTPWAPAAFTEWYLGLDEAAPAADYAKLGYTKTNVFREEGIRLARDKAAPERYLSCAEETKSFLASQVYAPYQCPMEDIREELHALPGFQCLVERCPISRRPFLPYVVRRMTAGQRRAAGNLHMDTPIPGHLSINLYLKVPGGEIVLYPVRKDWMSRTLNRHFFETIEVMNFYPDRKFYVEDMLASGAIEPLVYKPEPGDVVIVDPAYPHAVPDFAADGGSRLSLQSFLQSSWADTGRSGGEGMLSRLLPGSSRTRLLQMAV